ncbi:MAG: PAS domain-containing protein [Halothiobacillaceae bacterium]|nr:MAG: PAS domain-containing protein [Halothiobacillaceae bacterium]
MMHPTTQPQNTPNPTSAGGAAMTDSTQTAPQDGSMNFDVYALRAAVEGASTPMMMINKDLVITHVNEATKRMMRQHEKAFKKHFPFIDIERLVGVCIDDFHKKPEYQRRILSDARNFPWEGRITVDELIFKQNLNAILDDRGQLLGAVMEWREVSQEIQNQRQAIRFKGSMDNAKTAFMMCDEDLNITYANKSVVDLLRRNEAEIRRALPNFSAENLVGKNIDMFHANPSHQRGLLKDPSRMPYQARIKVASLVFDLGVIMTMDEEGKYAGNMVEWKDVTEQVQQEDMVRRLKASIDGASAHLLYVNEQFEVFHQNPAMRTLFSRYGAEMRGVFGGLDPENVIGHSADWLTRGDARLRERFGNAAMLPHDFEVEFAGRLMQVHVAIIRGAKGDYLGNRIEFVDLTEQRDAERQVAAVIQAAARGEFDRRMDVSHFDGFLLTLGQGINTLMDNVSRPIIEVLASMSLLADGDLSRNLDGTYQGDFAQLQQAFNLAVQNLRQMTSEIRAAADSISTASSEISQGNHDLSRRTEQQASNLEMTASSMEEITGTVKNNAENSARADKLAVQARGQATDGGRIAGRAINAMGEISNASKKIADIIGVIDEIAFQTNLLALNAAVEAARAGEQGRGFAVVAAEVRNLAQRSASAAKEIKGLIKDSLEKVSDGSRLVDETGKMLDGINQVVAEVGELISQIATAGKEQAIGIEQVNKALVKLDEMTQQNAALVEEAAAASSSLDEQAQSLQGLVQYFRLDAAPSGGLGRKTGHAPLAAGRAPAPASRAPARIGSGDESDWDQF